MVIIKKKQEVTSSGNGVEKCNTFAMWGMQIYINDQGLRPIYSFSKFIIDIFNEC